MARVHFTGAFVSFFFTVGFVHSMPNNRLASDSIVLDQIDTYELLVVTSCGYYFHVFPLEEK